MRTIQLAQPPLGSVEGFNVSTSSHSESQGSTLSLLAHIPSSPLQVHTYFELTNQTDQSHKSSQQNKTKNSKHTPQYKRTNNHRKGEGGGVDIFAAHPLIKQPTSAWEEDLQGDRVTPRWRDLHALVDNTTPFKAVTWDIADLY